MNEERPLAYLEVDFSKVRESNILKLLEAPPYKNTKAQTTLRIYRALLIGDYSSLKEAVDDLKKADPSAHSELMHALEEDGRKGIIRLAYLAGKEDNEKYA